MNFMILGLAIVAMLPAATDSNPSITIVQEPVVTRIIIESGPQKFEREGMEIRPQTRSYMRVIPTFRPGEQEAQTYTLEPDPDAVTPDLNAPDFKFSPIQPKPIGDLSRD